MQDTAGFHLIDISINYKLHCTIINQNFSNKTPISLTVVWQITSAIFDPATLSAGGYTSEITDSNMASEKSRIVEYSMTRKSMINQQNTYA